MDAIMLILIYKGKKYTKELKQGVISLKIAIFQISKWVLGLRKSFFQFTHIISKIFKSRKEQTYLKGGLLLRLKSVQRVHLKLRPLNCKGKLFRVDEVSENGREKVIVSF